MAFANYLMKGRRSLRNTGRYRYRQTQENDEDTVHIDFTKDVNLITYEILKAVCQKQDISEEKQLAYLNAFVKLLIQYGKDYFSKISYCVEDIFICVRITLLNDSSLVRAAGLRALRYLIKSEQHVAIMNKLQYPALIARSLDLILVRNNSEREQALRLTRSILIVAPALFHTAIARSLMCVALSSKTPAEIEEDKQRRDRKEEDDEEKVNDHMVRAFIAVITELCILNQEIFLSTGGVRALVHSMQVVRPGRMTESILGALLQLLNLPQARARAGVNLQFIAGSFTELPCVDAKPAWGEARPWYHVALLSLLRSVPGVLHFCHPQDPLCLRSLVDTLYLSDVGTRRAVLAALHELIGLRPLEWTDEFSVILAAVDPARFQDEFKLSEGFVAQEAKSILPHISKCRVNITELHLSLLLQCLLEAGLLSALIHVIVSEDSLLSVSATILLGHTLHLAHRQLPPEVIALSPAVPNLVSYAVRGRPGLPVSRPPSPTTPGSLMSVTDLSHGPNYLDQNSSKKQVVESVMEMLAGYKSQENTRRDIDQILNSNRVEAEFCVRSQQRALSAVTALSELHKMLRKRPAPASLFLDTVLSHIEPRSPSQESDAIVRLKGKNLPKHKIPNILTKESEEAIKDSGVLTVKDAFAWNWEAIRAVFKTRAQSFVRLEDSSHKMFLKKIVNFMLPSNNQLSRCDLSSNIYSLAGIDLLKFLLDCEHTESARLLHEFLDDLHLQLEFLLSAESAHDTLLSPKNVSNTLVQHYFLFIGVLSGRPAGLKHLTNIGILDILNRVAMTSKHDCYVKLIVSCLDYSVSPATRLILTNILTCDQVSSRHYATQFLSILLRTRLDTQPGLASWVVESLVNQLQDEKKLVSLCALTSLDEACDDKRYLEAVIALRPSLLYFGDRGLLLLIRFLSSPSGFSYLSEANFVANQLERWASHFNYRYVQLMEADIHDALTLHRRSEDGQYTRRLSSARPPTAAAYVRPHLYGMLGRHEAGFNVLRAHDHLYTLLQKIISGRCGTDEQILELKAALWGAGHVATSPAGVQLLSQQAVLPAIVRLAENCAVYSVRATAFYSLSLVASTWQGALLLHSMGWMSVRQNRQELWPPLSSLFIPSPTSSAGGEEGQTSEESSESSDHVTPLFFMGGDMGPSGTQLPWFRGKERAGSSERRSATLPHKSSAAVSMAQHVRSYSESKAESGAQGGESWDGHSHVTDELSDMRMSDVCKKSRSDSCCTDSSTSGVSSCDSGGQGPPRYHHSAHQTLSPIPSTGSIATMHSVQPKPPEPGPVLATPAPLGPLGKHRNSFSLRAKLLSQHSLSHAPFLSLRSLRPHSSPSVTLDLINFAEAAKMSPLVRPKLSAKYMHQPVSSEFEVTDPDGLFLLDEDPPHSLAPPLGVGTYPSSRSCLVPPTLVPEDPWGGPCYQGICLPLQLTQLFPPLESIYASQPLHRLDEVVRGEALSDQDVADSDNELDEVRAPISTTHYEARAPTKTTQYEARAPTSAIQYEEIKPKYKHDRSSCLLCVVKYAPNRSQILRNRKISASSIHRTRSETESSYGGGVGGDGESPVLVPWPQSKTPGLCETTPASGESLVSQDNAAFGFAKALMDSSSQSRSSVRKELLRLVELMANPILFRTSKQGLLTIKQSCKDLFQDVCVYSDVCNILAWCNHKLQARRFLQDLFIDSTFNELHEEPKSILSLSPALSLEADDAAYTAAAAGSAGPHVLCDTDQDKSSYKSVTHDAAAPSGELAVILEGEGGGESACASHGPRMGMSLESGVAASKKSFESAGISRRGECDSSGKCGGGSTSAMTLTCDQSGTHACCSIERCKVGQDSACGEAWCPESKSDQILETLGVYTSDSIDELSDETLFMKPCSSRLTLTSPQQCGPAKTLSTGCLLNTAMTQPGLPSSPPELSSSQPRLPSSQCSTLSVEEPLSLPGDKSETSDTLLLDETIASSRLATTAHETRATPQVPHPNSSYVKTTPLSDSSVSTIPPPTDSATQPSTHLPPTDTWSQTSSRKSARCSPTDSYVPSGHPISPSASMNPSLPTGLDPGLPSICIPARDVSESCVNSSSISSNSNTSEHCIQRSLNSQSSSPNQVSLSNPPCGPKGSNPSSISHSLNKNSSSPNQVSIGGSCAPECKPSSISHSLNKNSSSPNQVSIGGSCAPQCCNPNSMSNSMDRILTSPSTSRDHTTSSTCDEQHSGVPSSDGNTCNRDTGEAAGASVQDSERSPDDSNSSVQDMKDARDDVAKRFSVEVVIEQIPRSIADTLTHVSIPSQELRSEKSQVDKTITPCATDNQEEKECKNQSNERVASEETAKNNENSCQVNISKPRLVNNTNIAKGKSKTSEMKGNASKLPLVKTKTETGLSDLNKAIDLNVKSNKSSSPPDLNVKSNKSSSPPDLNVKSNKSSSPPDPNVKSNKSSSPPDLNVKSNKSSSPPDLNVKSNKSSSPPDLNVKSNKSSSPMDLNVKSNKSSSPTDLNVKSNKSSSPPDLNVKSNKSSSPMDPNVKSSKTSDSSLTKSTNKNESILSDRVGKSESKQSEYRTGNVGDGKYKGRTPPAKVVSAVVKDKGKRHVDLSVSKPVEASSGKLSEASTTKASEASSGKASEASTTKPSEASSGKASEASTTKASEASSGKASEASTTKPSEASSGKASEASSGKASEASTTKPSEASSGKASEASSGKASEASTNKPADRKPTELGARKSLPTVLGSSKATGLSARKSLPLTTSSEGSSNKPGKSLALLKSNGIGEDCRIPKQASSIPQHRNISYKPSIPGVSD